MEIHYFERLWLLASILLIVGFIGTVAYGAVGAGVKMVDDSGGTVDPSDPTASEAFRDPGTYRTDGGNVSAYVVARQFAFEPGSNQPLVVPADTRVTLHVTSGDVIHGYGVVGTNVNVMVIPGQVSEITVEFDEPGTYGVVCNEYCGVGHHGMAGTIEVVSEDNFTATGGDA